MFINGLTVDMVHVIIELRRRSLFYLGDVCEEKWRIGKPAYIKAMGKAKGLKDLIRTCDEQATLIREITGQRTLTNGQKINEYGIPVIFSVKTRCPEKWVFIDRETGDRWIAKWIDGWQFKREEEKYEQHNAQVEKKENSC